ncbi:hypothetical protein [Kribbella sp. NPDC055071]
MRKMNGRLIALVAAVAVAAIATGGALAYRQGPSHNTQVDAAPLAGTPSPGQTPTPPTPTPSATPKSTPPPARTPVPTATPSKAGPVKSKIELAKLADGRAPQVTYVSGRTVKGGPGQEVTVPGKADIQAVARLSQSVLAIVTKGTNQTEMLTLGSDGKILKRTPDVTAVVTTEDGMAAAYTATNRSEATGQEQPGAIIYAEEKAVQKLTMPGVYDAYPLGYIGGKVYFSARATEAGNSGTFYSWIPGASKATAIKGVPVPTALSSDGTLAASLINQTDYKSCTNVNEAATGKRLWKTCDYMVDKFTRDGSTAIAGPFYRDGYGDGLTAALDATTGNLLHEWSGVFRQTVAEDDNHLLILADDGEETPASIIRCTITTGTCERATPLAKGNLLIGS